MTCLDLRLLGGFEAQFRSGHRVAPTMRKTEALLAYLALNQESPRSRDHLVGLLWSDRAEEQAKTSLRQALTALRHDLSGEEAPLLVTEGDMVLLRPGAVNVDVLEFENQVAAGSARGLKQADALYRGPLLDGIKVRDRAFNDWLSGERRRLDNMSIDVLERILAGHLQEGQSDAAIAAAHRLLARDPLRESAYRTLMRLYAAQDQRGLAAREFERCRAVLARELQVEPAPATLRLYQEVTASGIESPRSSPMQKERPAALPLPAVPSIVVLPFANLSGDPAQNYLSDGITEDVITSMARFPSLFVIGPESALAYRDRAVPFSVIAGELGVEYVAEGSVRKAGQTLRVTVQLIDAATGQRLWAERYDRPFADVFAIQDEIVANIAGALSVNIDYARTQLARDRPSDTLSAYDQVLRGRALLWGSKKEGFARARLLFEKATELDPDYAPAWAGLALICNKDAFLNPGLDVRENLEKSRRFAEKAVACDPKCAHGYAQLAWVHLCLGELDICRSFLGQAAQWGPNDAEVLTSRMFILGYLGDLAEAIEVSDFGLRLNPYNQDVYLDAKNMALLFQRRFRDCVAIGGQFQDCWPESRLWLAVAHAHLGEIERAEALIGQFAEDFADVWEGDPGATAADYARWVVDRANPIAQAAHRKILHDGLALAGLSI